ncbi:T9SS type A sorting domain-containing protein [Flavobacterium sp.]|jgi:Secretion system C-terminal sorting domain|uniref:T9SS type A sorting domain-containing protein n=1 Tax=Flavobacterium sp. TaxID=239 RepID=UPI0025FEA0AF|nr:T9SS type A sorting domain-containing protein [Flavobacterium sp.]
MKQLLLLFFGFSMYGQQLHHQMLSSQGSSNLLSTGTLVHQTIGQQSVIGNYKFSNIVAGQGFQQSLITKSVTTSLSNGITTTTYPNPFVDQIHFQFSKPINGLITISIYDVLGRLVYKDQKEAIQDVLTLENLHFSQNEYLVKLSAPNYKYSTQIIQTK